MDVVFNFRYGGRGRYRLKITLPEQGDILVCEPQAVAQKTLSAPNFSSSASKAERRYSRRADSRWCRVMAACMLWASTKTNANISLFLYRFIYLSANSPSLCPRGDSERREHRRGADASAILPWYNARESRSVIVVYKQPQEPAVGVERAGVVTITVRV